VVNIVLGVKTWRLGVGVAEGKSQVSLKAYSSEGVARLRGREVSQGGVVMVVENAQEGLEEIWMSLESLMS